MSSFQLVVWLDSNANDPGSTFRNKLTEQQGHCVKTFTEINPCLTFIQTHVDQPIFFVLSGSFGSRIVPMIYNYEHIQQIYLFCGSISSHTSWAIDYIDKMLMFDHENDLLRRLFKEIEQYLRQQADNHIKQANTYKDRAQEFKQGKCE